MVLLLDMHGDGVRTLRGHIDSYILSSAAASFVVASSSLSLQSGLDDVLHVSLNKLIHGINHKGVNQCCFS